MSVSIRKWKPSPDDAINLSALRHYVIEIERLAQLIYYSDPTDDRQRFRPLCETLAHCIKDLRNYSKDRTVFQSDDCPGEFDLCDDGLCHPPGDCSS
jgi:hypothetical protein